MPPARQRETIPAFFLALGVLWGWAIWACAEHWQANPNYSYGWIVPLLVLFFALRRYLVFGPEAGASATPRISALVVVLFSAALALAVFFLEYARADMWHPQIVLWTICLVTTGATLATIALRGGPSLARAELFPILFFFTAVTWPPRFEQPITIGLMNAVATATTELLHWMGIQAQTSGGAIALRSGLVGVTEACSGIRSLQAGIMFSLAVGEWFWLRPGRRVVLILLAIVLALATNLARTLALTLTAERGGPELLERYHDLIGNIAITTLILAVALVGKFLARKSIRPKFERIRLESIWQSVSAELQPRAWLSLVTAIAVVAGILSAQLAYARVEARDRTQTVPFFALREDISPSGRLAPVPREIWNELRPTSGEYIQSRESTSTNNSAGCYHFFWKPSAWNRFALIHRPDICMPGVGWTAEGAPETRDLSIDGRSVRFYLFQFHRENKKALELWGAWRNGEAVSLDYQPQQILGAAPPPSTLQLGKRRSATEIVACNIISDGKMPEPDLALALLRSVFHYKPND